MKNYLNLKKISLDKLISSNKQNYGLKNLNKVPVPCVVSMAEKSIIVPKRPHARTIRPRQWHIARGGPTVEKKFRRGG